VDVVLTRRTLYAKKESSLLACSESVQKRGEENISAYDRIEESRNCIKQLPDLYSIVCENYDSLGCNAAVRRIHSL
jgi:hypothetical protein